MSEIGELTKPAEFLERHDEDCYFCNKEEVLEELTNDTEDDFNEDMLIGMVTSSAGIKHENNSGKLGTNCEPSPDEPYVTRRNWAWKLRIQFAAHHLIPGDASLKKSDLFNGVKYGLKKRGQAKGNIGYDVNNRANGVWLPGNYAFANEAQKEIKQGWGKGGAEFKEAFGVEPYDYASAAIKKAGSQFHDSHENYSKKVESALNKIHDKLKKTEDVPWCPEASNDGQPEKPLYALVGRLATLSGRMRRMLVFPESNWKLNIFTSAFSQRWMQDFNKR